MKEIRLINEIDDILNSNMNLNYAEIVIKKKIQDWRDKI